MWELEVQASTMAWDWDMDDIDPDDDNRKLWVPVTAQTLNTRKAQQHRGPPPPKPVMLPRQMTMYAVQPN